MYYVFVMTLILDGEHNSNQFLNLRNIFCLLGTLKVANVENVLLDGNHLEIPVTFLEQMKIIITILVNFVNKMVAILQK